MPVKHVKFEVQKIIDSLPFPAAEHVTRLNCAVECWKIAVGFKGDDDSSYGAFDCARAILELVCGYPPVVIQRPGFKFTDKVWAVLNPKLFEPVVELPEMQMRAYVGLLAAVKKHLLTVYNSTEGGCKLHGAEDISAEELERWIQSYAKIPE